MKEGVILFCPKCGSPVSKEDNFCVSCGHNLKDVKVRITSMSDASETKKEDTTKVRKVSEHTRVFNPKSLDAIDTTDELKNIIAEVDRKISKNIEDYKKGNVQSKSPKKEDKVEKVPEKDKIKKDSKTSQEEFDEVDTKKADKEFLDANKNLKEEAGISQKELIRRVQEELKKSNFEEKPKKTSATKKESPSKTTEPEKSGEIFKDEGKIEGPPSKKFSLREKWRNFINEDDDEFSIFSSINDDSKKKEDTRNLEITKSLENSDKSFENTLSTPKIDIEDAIRKSEEEKKKKEAKKAAEEIKKSEVADLKKSKDLISEKLDSEEKSHALKEKSPLGEKSENPKKAQTLEKEKKAKKLKKLFSFKDHGEGPVKEIEAVDSKVDKVIENNLSEKVNEMEAKISTSSMNGLDKIIGFLSKLTGKLSAYIGDFGSRESKIIIGVGAILNAIALLLGSGSFKIILIPFLLLKLLFDYVEFYVPLNIASDRDEIDTTYPEVKKFALINWIICKVFLFLGFIISPFGGFFHYNMLQALTAMPLATLLVIILSLLIAITLYKREFIGRSKINFIGWYAIAFTLFELLFKMIWFIINFIFVTLF